MGTIRLLDCTLRDGGYINNWEFGEQTIESAIHGLEESGIDILELGFLKDERYKTSRTVFNSMEQVKRLIYPKQHGIQYAVMAEAVNPLPLEQLEPADEESADIIRVIVWKNRRLPDGTVIDALQDGFEYCKGIVEKGYKLCVQPARVDQYSEEEFVNMIKLFNVIDPMAVYVVDSFGTQTWETLLPYFQLADKYLKSSIALGYHGHNNMMQAKAVAQAFLAMPTKRDKIVDSSIYGMGRGAGNLNTELFAEYLNNNFQKQYKILPMIYIYDKFLVSIYAVNPWGYSLPYYLTAINGCNPQYAGYLATELFITSEDIQKVLQTISDEDKIIFTKEKAKKYIQKMRELYFNKKLAVIVPTANREKDIDYYINTAGPKLAYWGIDLIIYDSSGDDSTKKIVEDHIEDGQKHLIYKRYTGTFDGVSLDEKFISACVDYMDDYKYLWICRDGLLVNIDPIQHDLRDMFEQSYDMIVVSPPTWDVEEFGSKKYTDCKGFFDDNACHMVILGTTIFSTDFLKRVFEQEPLDREKHYSLYMPIAMFHYIAAHSFFASHYTNHVFLSNIYGTPSSFWNKNGGALWQWGEQWYNLISRLPSIYDDSKPEVLKIGTPVFTTFGIKQLLIMRANGSLTLKAYKRNKKYIPFVTDYSLKRFFIISILPRWVCRFAVRKQKNPFLHVVREMGKKLFFALRKWKQKSDPLISLPETALKKDFENKNVVFGKNQLCIIVPTKDRADVIQDVLNCTAQLYRDYGIDVIIYDSSERADTKEAVERKRKEGFDNIHYKYYQAHDNVSLDDKVMSAYRTFCGQYEYIWVIRDRLLIQLNKCAYELKKALNHGVEMISIHNIEDDCHRIGDQKYDEADDLFKDQFVYMTVLGQVIVKSDFISNVLTHVPLDEQKNYSLWQPVAMFEYIAYHKFKAVSLTESQIFLYHPTVGKGSFWLKQFLWQWVERFYTIIDLLPDVYKKNKEKVIEDEQTVFGLLSPIYICSLKAWGNLRVRDVNKYAKLIPYVTKTPLKVFYITALTPKWCARMLIKHPNCVFSKLLKRIARLILKK